MHHSHRLRVVFCTDNLQIGGTELNAVRTAERLDRDRFDLSVVSLQPDGPLLRRYADAGIPVHPLPISSLYGPSALRAALRLRRYLHEERVQVFHAHDIYSNIFGVAVARAAGVPRVIASRRWWAAAPSRAHLHANRLAYRLSHAVLANAPLVAELVRRETGLPESRVAVVPNFLDGDAFDPLSPERLHALRHEFDLDARSTVMGIVANLRPVKDHATLVRALARLRPNWPELKLVMVGDGVCRAELERLGAELGVSGMLRFAGRRTNDGNLHHLFDISLLASRSEGLSNSLLEAMAAGRPVVATDVGATADAVLHERTGLLVPPSDASGFADALHRLLSDPAHAAAMGRAGLERARGEFSWAQAFQRLERLYEPAEGPHPRPLPQTWGRGGERSERGSVPPAVRTRRLTTRA